MTISVRPAMVDDAASIAEIHVAAWRHTYAHLLSGGLLGGLSVERRATGWRRLLDDGHIVYLAVLAGDVVGFAMAGPARGDDDPRTVELYAIYQVPAAHGSGTGQALLDAAIGDSPAFLWVAEDNPRAHAFYRRNRFTPDGARQIDAESEDLVEIRMVR